MKDFFIILFNFLFVLSGTLYFLEEYNVFISSHLLGGFLYDALIFLFFLTLYTCVVLWLDEYIREVREKDKPQE